MLAQTDDMRPWHVRPGKLPVVALAVHCGHAMRPEIEALSALGAATREREEDPHTQHFLPDDATQVIVNRSRFEVDLNRVREKAVYQTPHDAWGLDIWKAPPPPALVQGSLAIYDRFYRDLDRLLKAQIDLHGRVLLLDMHSYNYRRHGPHAPVQPPEENPEINLGTAPLGNRWESVVTRFIDDLSNIEYLGGRLDVRKNIRFRGGSLCRYVIQNFGQHVCPLAIEVKKFFMDEWSGLVYEERIKTLKQAFAAILPDLLVALKH